MAVCARSHLRKNVRQVHALALNRRRKDRQAIAACVIARGVLRS
jgi:hypothetical protein